MRKTIACLSIVFVLGAALAACGGDSGSARAGEEDLAALKTIQENVKAIKDAEIKFTGESVLKEKDGKETSLSKTSGVMKTIVRDADHEDMEITVTGQTGGSAQNGTIYIKDKNMYLHFGKQKVKCKDVGNYQRMGVALQEFIAKIDQENLVAIEQEKGADGQQLSLELDGMKMMEYLYDTAGISKENQADSEDFKVDTMKLRLDTNQDGQIKKAVISGSYDVPSGSDTAKLNYKDTLEFVSVNTGLTIDFPEPGSYKDAETQK